MSGLVTATVVVGAYSVSEASKSAKKGQQSQEKAAASQLAFEQQKYNRYLDLYGDMEENLSEFYSNLTPEYLETQGLQQEQQAYQQSITQMRERFAQTGITGGAQADIEARSELEHAKSRAGIRAEAPIKAAEQKAAFLGMGVEPQGMSSALATQAQQAGRGEAAEAAIWGQAAGSLLSTAGRQYALSQTTPPPAADLSVPPALPAPYKQLD